MNHARCGLRYACTAFALLCTQPALASQLVYTPVNPNFGGSPLNGTWMLGEANANNFRYLTPPNSNNGQTGVNGISPSEQFQSIVTSALLGQIAQQISQDILGQNAMDSGSFNVGGESVTFNRQGGQVNITLTDPTTGGTTNISVPIPQY